MNSPTCTIIAGPNGAGKTTFALNYLPHVAHCKNFVNADLIAAGLSPLAPERDLIAASKIFLREVHNYIKKRESFAFETTLSGKSYLPLIQQMLTAGWRVNLFYLWLPNVEASLNRVAERVSHGGHNIPRDAIIRRYPRSVSHLVNAYAPLCSFTWCVKNSGPSLIEIFEQDAKGRRILDERLYQDLIETGEVKNDE